MFPQTSNPPLMSPFVKWGLLLIPVMKPLFRDPLWGGLSLVPRSLGLFFFSICFLVDSLIAGVRKTQVDTLKVFIIKIYM